MRQRRDGIETRHRILEAAADVFAEKGFRDATVAEICERAGSNTASVNYHFGDKESLYVEVWKHAAEQATRLYPIDGGVAANAPPSERLRGHLHALLRRMTDSGRLGRFHRLHALEMANPTGFLDAVLAEIREPHREPVLRVLRELLGPAASEDEVELCELSVIGQCLAARHGRGLRSPTQSAHLTERDVEELADYITSFSLAGIAAARTRLESTRDHYRRGGNHREAL